MPQTFHIVTLGCKINQYESQALREAWQQRGLTEAATPAGADLLLVNSCAVTARAVRDLRQTLRRLHRESPDAELCVTGCAAALLRQELQQMPGVACVAAQAEKPCLVDPGARPPFAAPEPFALQIAGYQRARAVLKVQDGCSHGCSYCIVPLTRGPARSRPPREVLAEASRLLENGLRELVLSGVNLRQYRHEGRDFWDLLQTLDSELAPRWEGRARLRLSSLEPSQLTPRGLETLAGCRLLCPHLHLSLQSGSPTVLERMGRRHYAPAEVLQAVEQVQKHFGLLGLGADLLVGFPGESAAEFEETVELVESLPLTYAHVFPYSRRPGTAAANLPDQVPRPVKTERAALLRERVTAKSASFLQRLAQQERLQVLVETLQPAAQGFSGQAGHGRCEYYAPVTLQPPLPQGAHRRIVPARPIGLGQDDVQAVCLEAGEAQP